MKIKYWKFIISILIYIAFLCTSWNHYIYFKELDYHLILNFFQDRYFYIVFPLVFILNSPRINCKNSFYRLRLNSKKALFWFNMKRMSIYSICYVFIIFIILFLASYFLNGLLNPDIITRFLITSIITTFIMSGFMIVSSMYVGFNYTVILSYSISILLIILPIALFYQYFVDINFIYINMFFDKMKINLYLWVYIINFTLIALLYFLYDIRGKRDLI